MANFLVDTNIISELTKPAPNAGVVEFVSGLSVLWLSSITVHELEYGVALLPNGQRRQIITHTISELIRRYGDYIIPLTQGEAREAALLRVAMQKQGRVLHLADSLIAGTGKVHHLTVVTRNVKDFSGLGIEVFDPFT